MDKIRQKIFCFYLGYFENQTLSFVLFNALSSRSKLLTHQHAFPSPEHSAWKMKPPLLSILREPSPDCGGRRGG